MAVTQYIGARYVPLFADPAEWDSEREYEPLTIVLYHGSSYTSRQSVPKGIDILNTDFWVLTGNYNAQVEAYRREVRGYDARITENAEDIAEAQRGIREAKVDIELNKTAITNAQNDIDAAEQAIAKLEEQVEQSLFSVDTTADIANLTDVKANMNFATTGFSEVGDGGEAQYMIYESANLPEYAVQGVNAFNTGVSGLVAVYIPTEVINSLQFGAKGDGIADDTIALQTMLDMPHKSDTAWLVVKLSNGQYHTTQPLRPKERTVITADAKGSARFTDTFSDGTIYINEGNLKIRNVIFNTTHNEGHYSVVMHDCFGVEIVDCSCLLGFFEHTKSKFFKAYGGWQNLFLTNLIVDCGCTDGYAIELIGRGDDELPVDTGRDCWLTNVFVDNWLASVNSDAGALLIDGCEPIIARDCIIRSAGKIVTLRRSDGSAKQGYLRAYNTLYQGDGTQSQYINIEAYAIYLNSDGNSYHNCYISNRGLKRELDQSAPHVREIGSVNLFSSSAEIAKVTDRIGNPVIRCSVGNNTTPIISQYSGAVPTTDEFTNFYFLPNGYRSVSGIYFKSGNTFYGVGFDYATGRMKRVQWDAGQQPTINDLPTIPPQHEYPCVILKRNASNCSLLVGNDAYTGVPFIDIPTPTNWGLFFYSTEASTFSAIQFMGMRHYV